MLPIYMIPRQEFWLRKKRLRHIRLFSGFALTQDTAKQNTAENKPIRVETVKVIALTPAQYQLLSDQANACGLSKRTCLFRLIEGTPVRAKPSQEFKDLRWEVHIIGVNINQIARCHNPDLPTIALEFWGLPMAFADHSPTNPRKTLQARLTDFQTRYQRTKCYK